ncbi:MAG: PAS domain-containing protein [Rubrivivax sp.]
MTEELRPPEAAVLADLLDRMPVAAGLWGPSLRTLWINRTLAHWFGGEPAEFRGRPAGDLLGGEAMRARGELYRAAVQGRPQSYEAGLRTAQGTRRVRVNLVPADHPALPPGSVFGLAIDVTDPRAAEREQRALAEQQRLLYEKTPALLMSIDREGRLLAASDRWVEKIGFARAELIGHPITDRFTEESRRRALQLGLPALFRDGRIDRWAFELVCADGRRLSVLLSATLEGSDAARALAVVEDITAVLARAAELQREHALRVEVERHARELDALLAERTRMIDVLAHEVRQPLNNASAALQSAAALLAARGEAEASERLRRAQDVLGQVLAGVDNTLAAASLFSGSVPPALADMDIDTLLALAVADMRPDERPRVLVQRLTTTRTAAMDVGLVRLALRNLLANALAYSPPGSTVTVRVADSDEPLALLLDVVDQGPGIAPALLPQLFERGARDPRQPPDTSHGLGLYIARRALELQGGRVSVVETGPKGTTMRLALAQAGAL